MSRVAQISSATEDKSAAVSPALIQARRGKTLLTEQHHVMRFGFRLQKGGGWLGDVLTRSNVGG